MPSDLSVHAVQQGPMDFTISGGGHDVTVDYPLPGTCGDFKRMTPVRLLLADLAGCSGSSVAALLRRDGRPVRRVVMTARGQLRDEHPTVIAEIDPAFTVHGGVDPERVSMLSDRPRRRSARCGRW